MTIATAIPSCWRSTWTWSTINPWQPRTAMNPAGLLELQNEILAVGGCSRSPMARERDGRYQLAFGHRRIEACAA